MGILDWLLGRGAPSITPQEAHELLTAAGSNHVLLDVRQPPEYGSGVAPGAMQIPITQLSRRLDELPREQPVLTICASGHRSPLAARRLKRAGFDVHNVSGGMQGWRAAGLPVQEQGTGNR
jgi:rhodanese-related sulfurtransferase